MYTQGVVHSPGGVLYNYLYSYSEPDVLIPNSQSGAQSPVSTIVIDLQCFTINVLLPQELRLGFFSTRTKTYVMFLHLTPDISKLSAPFHTDPQTPTLSSFADFHARRNRET